MGFDLRDEGRLGHQSLAEKAGLGDGILPRLRECIHAGHRKDIVVGSIPANG